MFLQKLPKMLSALALVTGALAGGLPAPAQNSSSPIGRGAGTLTGDAAWVGKAAYGSSGLRVSGHGSLEIPQPVVDTAKSFTVSAWVKPARVGGYQTFVSIDGRQVSAFFLQLRDSGAFAFNLLPSDTTQGGSFAGALTPAQPGVWYYLVGVHDADAKTNTLYVNGVLQQTVPFATPWTATGHTAVGRGFYNGKLTDFADAEIDDVRIVQNAAVDKSALAAIAARTHALEPSLTLDLSKSGAPISPLLYGLMIEDISHSIDGGLYNELIQNRSLNDDPKSPAHWTFIGNPGTGTLSLDTMQPVPNTALIHCLRLDVTTPGADVGAANGGYWGVPVRPSTHYTASFYAKAGAGYHGPLMASLRDAMDGTVAASASTPPLSAEWKKYTLTLTTRPDAPVSTDNHFALSAHGVGTVWLTQVSLMPPAYHGRPNGSRADLMQAIAGLHPKFLRMPGGNYLEGNTIAERFDWKRTIGDVSLRPGHPDPWGYHSTDGYGLLEYLEWCDDLKMQTVLAVFAGYALGGERVPPGPALAPYVQDALDEIEYATGSPETKWGLVRIKNGHPAPFTVPYVEVGNEDFFDKSGSYDARFAQFYDAIHTKYPQVKLIATMPVQSRRPDVLDDHFYRSAADFEADTHHYDTYDRKGPKIFVGEYASQEGKPTPNLAGALGDAAFMTGFERNADVVVLASYAPLLVNVNPGAFQWPTNLIGFDALHCCVSPAYYTQQLFAIYHGSAVVPATLTGGSGLAVCASRSPNGTVYVKIVNALGTAQSATLTLAGAKSVSPVGTAITLSSANLSDTNTLTEPNKVHPIRTDFAVPGPKLRRTLPPYSLTVLIFRAAPERPVTSRHACKTSLTNYFGE